MEDWTPLMEGEVFAGRGSLGQLDKYGEMGETDVGQGSLGQLEKYGEIDIMNQYGSR